MTEGVKEALLSAAAELRGITRPSGTPPPRGLRLKLYADSLGAVEERGRLPAESVRAGREIARAFEAVTRGRSGPAMFSYGEERSG
jgi:hypothetical protein